MAPSEGPPVSGKIIEVVKGEEHITLTGFYRWPTLAAFSIAARRRFERFQVSII
jgi:hypothetical protein